ncbi:MAG TPA: VOC family protein [Vicinamibacterales bacterium]|nr:VOC family protein [Vicinamibacterales bacterium]
MAKRKSRPARAKSTRKPAARRSAARSKSTKSRSASKSGSGLQLRSLSPSLTVNDIQQSLDWYISVLGFSMGRRWERDNRLVGGELKAGDVVVYLSQEDGALGDRVKGQGFRLYWYTKQNIDKIAEGIKARGGTLASEPKDEYGSRSFSLLDPTGYKITVSNG